MFTREQADRLIVAIIGMMPDVKNVGQRERRAALIDEIARLREGKPPRDNRLFDGL